MPINRPNISINRTLLILLGILLACLLTINARSVSSESFSLPNQNQSLIDKNASAELLEKGRQLKLNRLAEKISSLK